MVYRGVYDERDISYEGEWYKRKENMRGKRKLMKRILMNKVRG